MPFLYGTYTANFTKIHQQMQKMKAFEQRDTFSPSTVLHNLYTHFVG